MTSSRVLNACVAASLCAHFLLFHLHWTSEACSGGEQILVPADFDVASLPGGEALSLGQAADPSESPDKGEKSQASRQRQALRQFTAAVCRAIEQRKFQPSPQGLEDLIGNASCTFTIMADGSFADLRLVRGSGVARLDQTAMLAVHAASGVVKRPKLTGSAPLHITVTVKYQHSL